MEEAAETLVSEWEDEEETRRKTNGSEEEDAEDDAEEEEEENEDGKDGEDEAVVGSKKARSGDKPVRARHKYSADEIADLCELRRACDGIFVAAHPLRIEYFKKWNALGKGWTHARVRSERCLLDFCGP